MTCKKLEHGPSGDQALPERAPWINIFKYKYNTNSQGQIVLTHLLTVLTKHVLSTQQLLGEQL